MCVLLHSLDFVRIMLIFMSVKRLTECSCTSGKSRRYFTIWPSILYCKMWTYVQILRTKIMKLLLSKCCGTLLMDMLLVEPPHYCGHLFWPE